MANGIPPVDALIKQKDQRAMHTLQQQYNQANAAIEKESNDGLRALNNQYNIKLKSMHAKFKSERDPEKRSAIEKQMIDIRTQFTGKAQALKDKFFPARRDLAAAARTDIQKIQRSSTERNIRLQTIRQLTQAGLMDQTLAKKAEYKMAGINWEPPKQGPSLEQEKTAIEDDLQDIREIIEGYNYKPKAGSQLFGTSPYGKFTNPITGKKQTATEEDAEQFKLLKEREGQLVKDYQSLLMRSDPRFRTTIERDQRNRQASKTLTGGARPNLETAIRSAVGEAQPKLDAATARKILQEAGGNKEKARQLAKSRGYKL